MLNVLTFIWVLIGIIVGGGILLTMAIGIIGSIAVLFKGKKKK